MEGSTVVIGDDDGTTVGRDNDSFCMMVFFLGVVFGDQAFLPLLPLLTFDSTMLKRGPSLKDASIRLGFVFVADVGGDSNLEAACYVEVLATHHVEVCVWRRLFLVDAGLLDDNPYNILFACWKRKHHAS